MVIVGYYGADEWVTMAQTNGLLWVTIGYYR